ncbi:MAG: hypothetical protein K0Q72_3229 [Armatimonadetes bacterium]|nr:hypothetical protein [Armatimonadota bacterium]
MPRFPFLVLSALLGALPLAVRAAEPTFTWAVRAGGAKHDKTRGLTTDHDGNVYMTGEFAASADFGPHTLTSRGDLDFFLAKYSPQGKCLWARQGGGLKTDRGYSVAVDAKGDVFVTGHYQSDDATFGEGPVLPLRGDYDVFTAKYDAFGKLLWLRTAGGEKYDYGHGVGVDGAGSCYVTGAIVGDASFGDTRVENPVGSHLFVVKYTGSGDLAWVRESRGASANGQAIAVDHAGNSWATGSTSGDAEIEGLTLKAGARDLYVVKLDSNGKPLWATGTGNNFDGLGTGIALDAQGNAYVGGMFKATGLLAGAELRSAGDHDMFTTMLDREGKPEWVRQGGGPGTDYCLSIAASPSGGCFAAGEIMNATMFDGQTVTSAGGRDLYLAHYDRSGKPVWFKQGGTEGDDLCYCITLDRRGSAYLSGAFNGTTRHGEHAITAVGGNDVFLTKVRLGGAK